VGFIIKFIWWILGTAALVGLVFVVRAAVRADRQRAEFRARHRAAIAARADQQHHWVLHGDDRGVYGPTGAALMHDIFPATKLTQAR
jgi:type II secretory pathway pseudopilin PulG